MRHKKIKLQKKPDWRWNAKKDKWEDLNKGKHQKVKVPISEQPEKKKKSLIKKKNNKLIGRKKVKFGHSVFGGL